MASIRIESPMWHVKMDGEDIPWRCMCGVWCCYDHAQNVGRPHKGTCSNCQRKK